MYFTISPLQSHIMAKRAHVCYTLSPLELAPLDTADAICPVYPPAVVLSLFIKKLGRYEHTLVEYIKSIVDIEFEYYEDGIFAYSQTIRTFEWPPWFTHVPYGMFSYSSLTQIEFSTSVTIYTRGLQGTQLRYFKLDDGRLGNRALANCINLRHVELGSVIIDEEAMSECINLVSVEVKKRVEMYANVFDGCIQLHTLALPEGSTVNKHALMGSSIIYFTLYSSALYPQACINSHVAVVTFIDTPITLPDGVFSFSDVVSVPPSLKYIPSRCFLYTNITSVTLEHVIRVGDSAFTNCKFLVTFNAPKCIYIGKNAFFECINLNTLVVADGCYLNNRCLGNTRVSTLGRVKLSQNALANSRVETIECIQHMEERSYYNTQYLTDIFIGCNIPNQCFFAVCLKRVRLDSTIKTLESLTFTRTHIETIEGEGITTIGEKCFYDCGYLVSARFPNLMHIGANAFDLCSPDISVVTHPLCVRD